MRYLLLVTLVVLGTLAPAQSLNPELRQMTASPVQSLSLTPDEIAKLVNECGLRTTQMTRRLYNYTFTATDTEYVIDKKNGQIKSERSKGFEVYPIAFGKSARWIYVQVSENGVPLSPERIARERERAARETTELEQASAKPAGQTSSYKPTFYSYGISVEKRGGLSRTVWYINPTDFLVSHDFFAPRRVSVAGRETLLMTFRPRPGFVYDKSNVPFQEGVEEFGKAMSQLGGRIWIDAVDKVIVRLEARPHGKTETDPSTNVEFDAKAPVWFEFIRLPNGTWVPGVSTYNSYGSEDVFWKTPISRSRRYTDFKLFKTTADVEKIDQSPAASPAKTPRR